LDKRLQKRYQILVTQHLHSLTPLACGIHALPSANTAFAATQAAWRFFRNPRVGLPQLIAPLIQAGQQAVAAGDAPYVLAVHDWSNLHFGHHPSKKDRARLRFPNDKGYELATALLVETRFGHPLAPVEIRLRNARQVFSSRTPAPGRHASHLDQLRPTMTAIAELPLARPVVHVIDAEADSVAHLRDWQQDGRLFVVRSDGLRRVRYQGKSVLLKDVATQLLRQEAFTHCRQVTYHGQEATQHIAEAEVVLDRPGQRHRVRGRGQRQRVPGPPLTLRLVVSRIVDEQGRLRAVWLLLSNLPAEVDAAVVALWYYWRWRIESFFKLLKSAGWELEDWQQQTAAALAKRLLVASMACVVVWEVARAQGPDAETLRALLVQLSGRQMKRGVGWTLPALLAGVWVLVALREALAQTPLEEMLRLAGAFLPPPTASRDPPIPAPEKGRPRPHTDV
jgi:Transposase DDE domain